MVRQHAGCCERGSHPGRDRPQVLADNQTAIALAFERHDAQKLGKRIRDVGAIDRHRSLRHPEQSHQRHDMIDAQGACMSHRCAQGGDEGRVTRCPQSVRQHRRQTPVLSTQVELIRGRADVHVGCVHGSLAPGFRASRIGADREIAVETDAKAACPSMCARIRELQLRLPLKVLEILGPIGVPTIELVVIRSRWRTILGRPAGPATGGACGSCDMLLQRVE